MMILNKLKNEQLIITPNSYKKKILKELSKSNTFYNIKFLTLDEFVKKYYFDYDIEALYYLHKKENIKIEVAKIYLDNLIYLTKDNYTSSKLTKLNDIKEFLIKENLLIFDNNFKVYLKTKNILIYGYNHLDSFYEDMLKQVECLSFEVVNEEITPKEVIVKSFKNIEDEVFYVFNKIMSLVKENVSLNNIYLVNVNDNYLHLLERFSYFYKMPINFESNHKIYSTSISKSFLSMLDLPKEEIIEKLSNEFPSSLVNQITNIINKCAWYEGNLKDLEELIIYLLKNTSISTKKYQTALQISNLNNDYSENDYVFLLGFNNELPRTFKDEEYITDSIKKEVRLDSVITKNKKETLKFLENIYNIKNLEVSFSEVSPFSSFMPSLLMDLENFSFKEESLSNNYYSDLYAKLKLSHKLDELIKFNKEDDEISKYLNTYPDISYLTYDNRFTGINPDKLFKYLDNNLVLSYSSLDNYNRCGFRYYINNVLKLDTFEESFAQFIGNLFHFVLSKAFLPNFDFDKTFNKFLEDKEIVPKEEFFLKKLKEELKFIIKTIDKQQKESSFTNSKYEERIAIDKTGKIKITFKGFVDKILYKEDVETYVAIIDYKTGFPHTNLSNTIYGIEMQLPVYMYLVKKSNIFTNPKFCGFYLQRVLNNEISIVPNKTYLELKEASLKLQGYSNSDLNALEKVDINYENSTVIQGMKMSSKGFYAYSKVLNDIEIEKLISLVEKKIEESSTKILVGDFTINPKVIGLDNKGCENCHFRDLCFKTDKDLVYLKSYKGLEYLGEVE